MSKKIDEKLRNVIEFLRSYIIGYEELFELLSISLLSGGHVLIEGPPGSGKTLTARLLALSIGGTFKRIQMTPDMLPSDILGGFFYDIGKGEWIFREGPIFANVIFIDELNRASPRTQSALLEAMQEGRASIEGVTKELPRPNLFIATQMTKSEVGIYPLTPTLLDRFAFSYITNYLETDKEKEVLDKVDAIDEVIKSTSVSPILSIKDILMLQEEIKKVYVDDKIKLYIASIVGELRKKEDMFAIAPSTRASVWLFKGSRALAFLEGNDYVSPDHVKKIARYVLRHRLFFNPEAELKNVTSENIISSVLEKVEVPKV
ncbi:AAA family ATPase [Fervidicoccus sp.]|uniref:AAA family ATPase n=1 Tax=Fervidicoccus sp. TaxID=2060324 RepID=UPI003D0A8D6F